MVPVPNFLEKFDLGAIFYFQDFQKGTLWATLSHKVYTFAVTFSHFGRPCRDPAFHETMVIIAPLGPSGFQKVIFFDGEWFIFFFLLCFSMCYVLHDVAERRVQTVQG